MAVWLTRKNVPAPTGRARARGLDPWGQVLGIVGVLALAGMLNEAGTQGWSSPVVLGAGALAAVTLVLFVVTGRRMEARGDTEKPPLLPLSLFGSPGFASTAAVGVLLNLGYYGMLYLSTLYLQNERGYDALGAGLALLPTVCMAVVAAPLSGRLTARYGPYVPMTGALLLGAAGFVGWMLAGPFTPYWMLLPALIATGLATPSTVPAATAAIVHAAPAENAGVASAVFNVARQLGNALGVALFASLIASRDLSPACTSRRSSPRRPSSSRRCSPCPPGGTQRRAPLPDLLRLRLRQGVPAVARLPLAGAGPGAGAGAGAGVGDRVSARCAS
ncbi:MFS transporter [Streptomyces calvus]